MTCNDCGRDINDCDRYGCRDRRGVSWQTTRQTSAGADIAPKHKSKNDEAWDLMQQANNDMDEDVQL